MANYCRAVTKCLRGTHVFLSTFSSISKTKNRDLDKFLFRSEIVRFFILLHICHTLVTEKKVESNYRNCRDLDVLISCAICTAKTKCRKFKTYIPRKGISGLSPNFHIHVSMSELYIPTMGLPVLLEKICRLSWEYRNRSQTHECGNWGWGRAIPRKAYINGIAVCGQFSTNGQHFQKNSCYWTFKNVSMLKGVPSWEDCGLLCFQNPDCQLWAWRIDRFLASNQVTFVRLQWQDEADFNHFSLGQEAEVGIDTCK